MKAPPPLSTSSIESTLRALAREEAAALDAAAFVERLRAAAEPAVALRPRADGHARGGGHPAQAHGASPWSALPLGLALALTAWLALVLMGDSATQWAAALEAVPAGAPGVARPVSAWVDALASQLAAGVLCAWCAWTVWGLRRWAWQD